MFEDDTVGEVRGYDLNISGIRNELSIIADFAQYDIRVNPNNTQQLFLPDGDYVGRLQLREKLPTAEGISYPSANEQRATGYINEADDAVECVLNVDRFPQSGPISAWDMMAVLMAGYESSEKQSTFIDITDLTEIRTFLPNETPDPNMVPKVYLEN